MRYLDELECLAVSGGSEAEAIAKLQKVTTDGTSTPAPGTTILQAGQWFALTAGTPYAVGLPNGGFVIVQCPEPITIKVEVKGTVDIGKLLLTANATVAGSTSMEVYRECTFTLPPPKSGLPQQPGQ